MAKRPAKLTAPKLIKDREWVMARAFTCQHGKEQLGKACAEQRLAGGKGWGS